MSPTTWNKNTKLGILGECALIPFWWKQLKLGTFYCRKLIFQVNWSKLPTLVWLVQQKSIWIICLEFIGYLPYLSPFLLLDAQGKKHFTCKKERNVWNWSFHGGHKLACKAPSSPGERFDPLSYNQKYSQNDVTWRRLSFLVHHSREWRHICSILKHISPQFWNIFLRFQKHQIFISHASCPTRWYLLTRIDEVSSWWLEILHFFETIFWIHTNLRIKINKILWVWSAYMPKGNILFSPHMRFTQPI